MKEREEREHGALGIALVAVTGFAAGVVGGMVLGGSLGNLHAGRVQGALGRLRKRSVAPPDPQQTAAAVRDALRADETTRDLDLEVHAPGAGLVELTGVVSDALVRRAAADIARAVPGVEVVVNRILLRETDLPPQPAEAPRRGT